MNKTIPNTRLSPLKLKRNTIDPNKKIPEMKFTPLYINDLTDLSGNIDPIFQKESMKVDERD